MITDSGRLSAEDLGGQGASDAPGILGALKFCPGSERSQKY